MKYALILSLLIIAAPVPAFSHGGSNGSNYILLTGFGPFDGYAVNPSEMVVEEMNGSTVDGAMVITIVLPVDFNQSAEKIRKAIEKYEPVAVICMGLDGYARKIEVEKVALNIKSMYLGDKFLGWRRIERGAPLFMFSTLPVEKIVESIEENGTDARISYFAGTYSCNYVFYSTLLYMEENGKSTPAGFIHLPPLKSQKSYGMELEEMVKGIKIAMHETMKEVY